MRHGVSQHAQFSQTCGSSQKNSANSRSVAWTDRSSAFSPPTVVQNEFYYGTIRFLPNCKITESESASWRWERTRRCGRRRANYLRFHRVVCRFSSWICWSLSTERPDSRRNSNFRRSSDSGYGVGCAGQNRDHPGRRPLAEEL